MVKTESIISRVEHAENKFAKPRTNKSLLIARVWKSYGLNLTKYQMQAIEHINELATPETILRASRKLKSRNRNIVIDAALETISKPKKKRFIIF